MAYWMCSVLCVLCLAGGTGMLYAGKPAPGMHPVVDLTRTVQNHANNPAGIESGFLFGGTSDGKWLDGDTLAKKMQGGERYRIYSAQRLLGVGTADKPVVFNSQDDGGYESPSLTMTLPRGVKPDQTLIGIGGEWNALSRVPKEQSVQQPAYLQVVQEYLTQHKAKNAKANITRILRIDLEGDGTDEVLINAVTPKKDIITDQGDGDYSVVLMRKIVNGKAVTIPVAGYIYEGIPGQENLYHLEGAFDVNGDGVMEILVRYNYHEGFGSTLYRVQGASVKEVLGAGSGV